MDLHRLSLRVGPAALVESDRGPLNANVSRMLQSSSRQA